ncbi:MAG: hypothetical protein C0402_05185 [Thermodesulfovibrio sp.]|nr:hypothetical protein [Thermodesulfovibrio sp.]
MKENSTTKGEGFDAEAFLNRKADVMEGEAIVPIPVDRIAPNPFQPRKIFDKKKLEELAADIADKGVTNAVIVRPMQGILDQFELCAGERRLRASRLVGCTHIPAVIRDYNDIQMRAIANTENTQREQLHFMETAEHYTLMLADYSTAAEVARHVGKDRKHVDNYIKIHEAIQSHPAIAEIFHAQAESITYSIAKQFSDVAADVKKLEKSNRREFARILRRMAQESIADTLDWVVDKASGKNQQKSAPPDTVGYTKEVEAKGNVSLTIKLPRTPLEGHELDDVRQAFDRFIQKMENLWAGATQPSLQQD